MTTARQIYESVNIELNKEQAPSLILEDFNYFINKTIDQYTNLQYNGYDANQQSSDNLRVLKATQPLKPFQVDSSIYGGYGSNYENIWEVELPPDYYHILNCLVTFEVLQTFKCYDKGSTVEFPARRLTSDMWSQVINNAYMKPSYRRPYFFIHNVNSMGSDGKYVLPTNEFNPSPAPLGTGTDPKPTFKDNDGLITIDLSGLSRSLYNTEIEDQVERLPGMRYGNKSAVRMEIRYGRDASVFKPILVRVDYLKTPQHIRLTEEQIQTTIDTSQVMEFPDYVCIEIINGLVKLVMENASDPRLQTNLAINQSIAQPGQQQTR